MKKIILIITSVLVCVLLCACQNQENISSDKYADMTVITFYGDSAKITKDFIAEEIPEYDYTWHCDPSVVHDDVKDAPAEYYTGSLPINAGDVYIDHDLQYYPLLDEEKFKQVNYGGEREIAYYYGDGENEEYIFGTLPSLSNAVPLEMMHSEEEALKNKVLHITKEGTYVLKGNFSGEVVVDLGENARYDETKVVTLILAGCEINCSVAPGIIFKNVYECDANWEEREEYTSEVNTENAGARVIIADDTTNVVSGCNIYRMLKTKYKSEADNGNNIKEQKKVRKIDSPLYSYMSMNIYGEEKENGKLTVNSTFEGIGSELHLTIYSGNLIINSQDDGINVNEDGVSVAIFKGGDITINAALGAEGDGVDSNGFIVVEGGKISLNNIRGADNGLDSGSGIFYYGGEIYVNDEKKELEVGSKLSEVGGRQMGGFKQGNFDRKNPNNFSGEMPPDGMFRGNGKVRPDEMSGDFNFENFRPRSGDDNFERNGDFIPPQPPNFEKEDII